MRPAAAHRHPESLRRAHGDVGTPLARRDKQRERERIGRHAEQPLPGMDEVGYGVPVWHVAVGGGVLNEPAKAVARRQQGGYVAHHEVDAQRLGPRGQHLDRLRVAPPIDEKPQALALGDTVGERHRLGGSSGLVEHRGIGDRQPGEIADHRLEVDDRLHPTLGDFGLVGCVGRVPGGILEHVPQDHGGGAGGVIALANEALEHLVAAGNSPEFGQGGSLGYRPRQPHRLATGNARRHDLVDQRGPRGGTDRRKHRSLVGGREPDVSAGEVGGLSERSKCFGRNGDRSSLGPGRQRGPWVSSVAGGLRVNRLGGGDGCGGDVGHARAPSTMTSARAAARNPVVLEPERFAVGTSPAGCPFGGCGTHRSASLSNRSVSSVLLPERSAFGGLRHACRQSRTLS